jgi:hypothetical protein
LLLIEIVSFKALDAAKISFADITIIVVAFGAGIIGEHVSLRTFCTGLIWSALVTIPSAIFAFTVS